MFAIAFVAALILTPLAWWTARRLGVLDHPGGYKAHQRPTPLFGGFAVAGGLLIGMAWTLTGDHHFRLSDLLALGCGSLIILTAGVVDDLRFLTARQKLTWQLVAITAAGASLALFGVRVHLFLDWPPISLAALTVLWILAVTNALNLFDNMNGLCAGTGGIAACFLAAYNLKSGELTVAVYAAALGGACFGFLPFNWPRAKLFLGDAGSMVIGFSLATLSVMGVYTPEAKLPVLAILAPLLLLAVPLFDMVIVVLLRLRTGQAPWHGDRRHISHRLVQRGLSPALAVVTLWLASLFCGFAALLLPTVGLSEAPILVALVGCALAALALVAGSRGLP